jgi:hypothetical protein
MTWNQGDDSETSAQDNYEGRIDPAAQPAAKADAE